VNAPPAGPDKVQVQRLIVYSYPLNRCRHFVLQVIDPVEAREFLARLAECGLITNASLDNDGVQSLRKNGICPLNIGFTYRGLEALELPEPYLRVFQEKAKAYAEGAPVRAARRLADTGPSAAEWWEECFKRDHAHVLLTMHADDDRELDEFSEALETMRGVAGLDGWNRPLEGCHLTEDPKHRTVHFGFRDGISDPAIKGFHEERTWRDGSRMTKLHAPGEFLLGYRNDEGFNPWLLINPSARPNRWLLPLNPAPLLAEFFKNGSFAALRKMEQDEREFRGFVAYWARERGVTEEYVKAKLSGRWDDGRVVKPGEEEAPSSPAPADPAEMDEFDFADDPHGEGCPFGSHIRRMNPRTDQVVPARARPLIRRSMPYGLHFEESPNGKRGLLGLFFCASLEDQFEHLLAEWGDSNPMGLNNQGNSKDPLIGNHDNQDAFFDIPVPGDALCQIKNFTPFVTTRGTLYAFFPGLTALRMIPSLGEATRRAAAQRPAQAKGRR